MEFKGRIAKVFDLSGITKDGNPFVKYQYLIQGEGGERPPSVVVIWFGAKAKKLEVGDMGTASLNLEVKEYNGKYYNNVGIWKWISDETF